MRWLWAIIRLVKKMRHSRLKLNSCALADCNALQKAPERRLSCVYIRCVFLSLPAPYWYIRCVSFRACVPAPRRVGQERVTSAQPRVLEQPLQRAHLVPCAQLVQGSVAVVITPGEVDVLQQKGGKGRGASTYILKGGS